MNEINRKLTDGMGKIFHPEKAKEGLDILKAVFLEMAEKDRDRWSGITDTELIFYAVYYAHIGRTLKNSAEICIENETDPKRKLLLMAMERVLSEMSNHFECSMMVMNCDSFGE